MKVWEAVSDTQTHRHFTSFFCFDSAPLARRIRTFLFLNSPIKTNTDVENSESWSILYRREKPFKPKLGNEISVFCLVWCAMCVCSCVSAHLSANVHVYRFLHRLSCNVVFLLAFWCACVFVAGEDCGMVMFLREYIQMLTLCVLTGWLQTHSVVCMLVARKYIY